eukprot:283825_1
MNVSKHTVYLVLWNSSQPFNTYHFSRTLTVNLGKLYFQLSMASVLLIWLTLLCIIACISSQTIFTPTAFNSTHEYYISAATNDFNGGTIMCGATELCYIECYHTDSCSNTIINCTASMCNIKCNGQSCSYSTINCQNSGGQCRMDCRNGGFGVSTCQYTDVVAYNSSSFYLLCLAGSWICKRSNFYLYTVDYTSITCNSNTGGTDNHACDTTGFHVYSPNDFYISCSNTWDCADVTFDMYDIKNIAQFRCSDTYACDTVQWHINNITTSNTSDINILCSHSFTCQNAIIQENNIITGLYDYYLNIDCIGSSTCKSGNICAPNSIFNLNCCGTDSCDMMVMCSSMNFSDVDCDCGGNDACTNFPATTYSPTISPVTLSPTISTSMPTSIPSISPSKFPTDIPTYGPTSTTNIPTLSPTSSSVDPSQSPSIQPSQSPTLSSQSPSIQPSTSPTVTSEPTNNPSNGPTTETTYESTILLETATSETTYEPANGNTRNTAFVWHIIAMTVILWHQL